MNKLTVIRFAPRREIKLTPTLRTALTCRWVRDPRSGRLVCRWVAQDSVHAERPRPIYDWRHENTAARLETLPHRDSLCAGGTKRARQNG
jgi:hypothetical protein